MKKTTAALLAAGTAAAVPFWYLQNRIPQATDYVYRTGKVRAEIRIAIAADLHGERYGKDNVRLLRLLAAQKPDLILIPGDLTDSYLDRSRAALAFAERAAKIAPCYYVTGNHEHRMEIRQLDAFLKKLERTGVTVLRDRTASPVIRGTALHLIGADCPHGCEAVLKTLTDSLPEDGLRIILSHKPHYAAAYAFCGADLAVCGHAHGGQFRLPGIGALYAPGQGILPGYSAGMYRIGKKTVMCVSRGLGNSSFPFRLFNRPELVVLRLLPDA